MNKALTGIVENKASLQESDQPEWIPPMRAKLTKDYFSDPGWVFERKLDGQRCLVYKKGSTLTLYSINRLNITNTSPEIARAFARLDSDFIIDGEIVALDGHLTSFSLLQKRMGIADPAVALRSKTKVYFYALDILYLDHYLLTALPLIKRKLILKSAIDFRDPFRYTAHRKEEGLAYYKEACEKGWEGLIAKKADAAYVSTRSGNWLKFKFKYAGKAGTGYDNTLLKRLSAQLKEIQVPESPFRDKAVKNTRGPWVRPELVCEIGITEWTNDGKLKHPGSWG